MTPGDAERRVAAALHRLILGGWTTPSAAPQSAQLVAYLLAPRVLTAIRAGVAEYANLLRRAEGMTDAEVDAHTVAAGVRALRAPVAETRPAP